MEERAAEEAQRKAEEEEKRKAAEKAAEEKRIADEKAKREEAEKQQKEAEEQRKAEEERKQKADEAKQYAAEIAKQWKSGTVDQSKMKDPKDFREEIEGLSSKSADQIWNVEIWLERGDITVEKCFGTLTKMLLNEVAHGLRKRADYLPEEEKKAFYGSLQGFYRSAEQGLREFVPTQVDMSKVEEAVAADQYGNKCQTILEDTKNQLIKHGLKDYYKSVEAQNAAKRQAEQKPSQPQNNAPKKEQSKGGMTK